MVVILFVLIFAMFNLVNLDVEESPKGVRSGAANGFHRFGNGRQTTANPFAACMFDEIGVKSVRQHRFREGRKERERGCGVGSIPISTNHIFFPFFYLKSLLLHQMFKPFQHFSAKFKNF
ncbi:hypothetical protein HanIR_Chr15g0759991 [Helianthus annuus]|nr:hypothetical protein HanIR_Chr15g0759991 [Helianthus annuus]